ncbi:MULTISPECIES: hypothetical protein [Bacillaceae]|uniref:hypothetical protein n=1 Tax=Bacillaceae TaxID=186817 RepID=UPI002965168A|nr:hypothetical protein [Bacillus infantis]MDW2876429.1 hypothetical protein [Bacillus infantis]
MTKFLKKLLAVVLLVSLAAPWNNKALAADNMNYVNESISIYNSYFKGGKHQPELDVLLQRNAIDVVFLATLYNTIKNSNPTLASSVRTDAISLLDDLRMEMHKNRGWEAEVFENPDAGLVLFAFSKGIEYLKIQPGSAKDTAYRNLMTDIINEMSQKKSSKLGFKSSDWTNPPTHNYSCAGGLKAYTKANNVLAVYAAGLAAYNKNIAQLSADNEAMMKEFGLYTKYTQQANGVWLIGASSGERVCNMDVGYFSSSIFGSAVVGKYTAGESSIFYKAAINGVEALDEYNKLKKDKNGIPLNTMEKISNGLLTASGVRYVDEGQVHAWALPISYVDTVESETLFNRIYPPAKEYVDIYEAPYNLGNGQHFHRLIHGLAGALENGY